MYSWQRVSLFLPAKQKVLTVVVVNLLVFSLASGISYYSSHLSGIETSSNIPLDQNFVSHQGNVFWIGYHSDNGEKLSTKYYSIDIYSNGRTYSLPLLTYELEREDPGINDFTEVQVSLMDVTTTQIWVTITEFVWYTPFRSKTGSFDTVFKTQQYLLAIDYSLDGGPSLRGFQLDTITHDYIVKNLKSVETGIFLQLRPFTEKKKDYQSNTTMRDWWVISKQIGQKFINNPETRFERLDAGLTTNGEMLQLSTTGKINLTELLQDEFGTNMGLHQINYLNDPQLQQVDQYGRLHFSGIVEDTSNPLYDIEGNSSLELNTPDYAIFDPVSGEQQYWDIVPVSDDNIRLRIAVVNREKTFIGVITHDMVNFYKNLQLRSAAHGQTSSDLAELQAWNLYEYLQLTSIDPMHPTAENMIQFTESISQTAESTVTFPRPINFTRVNVGVDEMSHYTLSEYNQHLYATLSLYRTNSGLQNYLQTTEGERSSTVSGKRLIMLDFTTAPIPQYIGYYSYLGPDKELPDTITASDLNGHVDGISVEKVYSVIFLQKDGDDKILTIFSGTFYKIGITREWGVAIDSRSVSEVFT